MIGSILKNTKNNWFHLKAQNSEVESHLSQNLFLVNSITKHSLLSYYFSIKAIRISMKMINSCHFIAIDTSNKICQNVNKPHTAYFIPTSIIIR